MIQVNVSCPACGESLMDRDRLVGGFPAIHTRAVVDGREMDLRLSSGLGDYTIECEADIPDGLEVTLLCPGCGASLTGTRTCELCSAAMAHLRMREGGGIQICCRRGCRKHVIEFEHPETEVSEFYRRNPVFWDAYHPPTEKK
jgi:hypothetical protein